MVFSRSFLGDVYLRTLLRGAQDKILYDERTCMASSKVFGTGMYYPLHFQIEAYLGEVKLTLVLEGTPAEIEVRIIRPVFY